MVEILKFKIKQNYIYKFSSYHAANTFRLGYKNQLVNITRYSVNAA